MDNSAKFLGVIFDRKLSWKLHIDCMSRNSEPHTLCCCFFLAAGGSCLESVSSILDNSKSLDTIQVSLDSRYRQIEHASFYLHK